VALYTGIYGLVKGECKPWSPVESSYRFFHLLSLDSRSLGPPCTLVDFGCRLRRMLTLPRNLQQVDPWSRWTVFSVPAKGRQCRHRLGYGVLAFVSGFEICLKHTALTVAGPLVVMVCPGSSLPKSSPVVCDLSQVPSLLAANGPCSSPRRRRSRI
jgi:hypothetical protein